jgi:hypothetical protein
MADSIFDFVAEKLEECTALEKLQARGTLRIALKQAGLDARSVTRRQMAVMLERSMPVELAARGVSQAEELCRTLVRDLEDFSPAGDESGQDSPEDVFRRLGGR